MLSTRSQTPVSVIGSASIVKPGLTPVPSTATFAFFASCVDGARVFHVGARRIGELLGRRDDRDLQLEDLLHLREDLLQRRQRAEDDDVGLGGLDRLLRVGRNLDAQRAADAGDLAEIASGLGRIDVDGADDLEAAAIGDLPDHRRADRPEPVMQDRIGPFRVAIY